ncbi:MAG: site-specific DNA-methyltransferase [Clostridia bacterium]|nr:site-specific DNA-methyltransferase [Clostridia bacterium]
MKKIDSEGKVKYLSVKETAAKWGVTERRITQMCNKGLIKGAIQRGEAKKYWLIPTYAKKPEDKRVRTGRYSKGKDGILDRFMNELFETDPISKLKELPAGSVDMIITDLSFMQRDEKDMESLPTMWSECRRVLKDTGIAVVCTEGPRGFKVIAGNEGWLRYKFTWIYNSGWIERCPSFMPRRHHMDVWVFAKDDETASLRGKAADFEGLVHYGSDDAGCITDVICFQKKDGSMVTGFESEKELLGRFLIRTYTKPGDVVLDNACSMLSFIKAALGEGRNFIGMEARNYPLSREYYKDDAGSSGLHMADSASIKTRSYIEDNMLDLYKVWKDLPMKQRLNIEYAGEIAEFERYNDDLFELYNAGEYPDYYGYSFEEFRKGPEEGTEDEKQ